MISDPTTNASVLLVDDNVTFLYALSEGLRIRLRHVNFVTCNSGLAALKQIEATDYDAIVSDIKMPNLDGLQLLSAIRKRRPSTPTLLITGYEEYSLAVQALRGGAYDIIQKPIDWDYFIASISSAIHTKQVNDLSSYKMTRESLLNNRTLLAGLKILIVDDDTDGRNFQSTVLSGCGAQVLAVGSVRKALEVFEQFDPDLLVGDIRMPLEDGYSLIRKVRRRKAKSGGDIPAISVTAYFNEEERVRALRAGYQIQIPKPLDPGVLALTVASVAGRIHNS